ncbi:TPA: NAD(P)-dependent oxidoreductase [Methanosarcina acetivorans]|uniref:3-hydroxyisobutyrate dehydrogenase n=2 Tax=Methanosarcina acetivorans TaxID=2214 RepID=Q8TT25_METAC|nr:NAD(P)-dependent oxidoreductase [Methanosarcina acetivorans]AAM04058.1 3-hydroxyisobutyrate dehydrogenase [Methanosarcina acetivorans C2A]HIH94591.1 NAD(P)-dependent oxidoreductase [Methanosarcina acetivorans]
MTTSGCDKNITVGVIGLGIMGSSFASNLLSRGYNVHVYNRTKEKAQPLIERGATFHSTPRELASVADIIMTSLTDEAAVNSVAFGEDGLLNGAKKGCLWIDLSTIDPSSSVKHAEAAKKAGLERLDTPVVGSKDLASKGELIILVGGSQEVLRKHEKFLNKLGKSVIYLGADGNGHKMKLAINLHLGLLAESFSEALVFSQKLGFDAKTFVETINNTPIRNYISQGKGPRIVEGNFEPAFSLNNLAKDLRLVNEQITKTGAILPMTKVSIEEYSRTVQNGEGQKDFSVIALEIQRKNGIA